MSVLVLLFFENGITSIFKVVVENDYFFSGYFRCFYGLFKWMLFY